MTTYGLGGLLTAFESALISADIRSPAKQGSERANPDKVGEFRCAAAKASVT